MDYDSGWDDVVMVYDGYMLIEERTLTGNTLIRRYYYEDGINKLALVEVGTTKYIPITDDRGTLMGVADSTGTIIEKLYYNSTGLCRSYNAAGSQNQRPSTTLNIGRSQYIPFGWCGMYHDSFTGKYHTHHREFDPIHNRWLSEDPAGYKDGLNLYAAYMGVNGLDLLGLGRRYDRFMEVKAEEKAVLGKLKQDVRDNAWNIPKLVLRGAGSLGRLTWYGIPGACDRSRDKIDEKENVPESIKTIIKGFTYGTEYLTEGCYMFSLVAPAAPVAEAAVAIPYLGPVIQGAGEVAVVVGTANKTCDVGRKLMTPEGRSQLDGYDFWALGGLWYGTGSLYYKYNPSNNIVSVQANKPEGIKTEWGTAIQEESAVALQAKAQIQNGAIVYKGGTLGISEAGSSQFLATEIPLRPGYAAKYGIPPKNANFNFVITGKVRTGSPVITRSAPGIPPNPGGGIEAVIDPGNVIIDSFYMP